MKINYAFFQFRLEGKAFTFPITQCQIKQLCRLTIFNQKKGNHVVFLFMFERNAIMSHFNLNSKEKNLCCLSI